jgi:hypothetical protein
MLCSAALALAGCGGGHGPGTGTGGSRTAGSGSTTSGSGTETTSSAPGSGGPTQAGGGKIGPEGIPIELGPSLAPASTTTPGTPVDGIKCPQREQLVYHIHAHLQIYVDGQPRQLPGGIGIIEPVPEPTQYGVLYAASRCYYWLHAHTADGVIHVESPFSAVYTLGEFFDEWRQPLSSDQVAGAHGPVTALVNGKRWTKSPRAIRLLPHAVIQLEVGKPLVPFHNVSFAGTGL